MRSPHLAEVGWSPLIVSHLSYCRSMWLLAWLLALLLAWLLALLLAWLLASSESSRKELLCRQVWLLEQLSIRSGRPRYWTRRIPVGVILARNPATQA